MLHENLKSLRLRVVSELETKGYGKQTIANFNYTMNQLEKFMSSKGLSFYSPEVGDAFLEELFASKNNSEMTKYQKAKLVFVKHLSEMLRSGHLYYSCPKRKKILYNALGMEDFENFFNYWNDKRSKATIKAYRQYLESLYTFLLEKGKKIRDIEMSLMIQFLAHLKKTRRASVCLNVIKYTRVFFVIYAKTIF